MAGGEVCKKVFSLITTQIVEVDEALDLPNVKTLDCCYQVKVLADNVGTDYNQNDRSSYFIQKGIAAADITLHLEKFDGSAWQTVEALTDDSFGTFFDFGFWETTAFKSMGYLINWHLVLVDVTKGEGSYRIRAEVTTVAAATLQFYSCEYCLKIYSAELAYKTIRFDTWINGITGDQDDRKACINYGKDISNNGIGWFSQIRVDGVFGYETRENEQTFRQFKNKSQQQLESSSVPSFTAFLDEERLPFWMHKKLMLVMQSDFIQVTDYNQSINPDNYIDFPVIGIGNYEPEYFRGLKNSKVELQFQQKFNTFQKKPC